jgi:hypothetical protein
MTKVLNLVDVSVEVYDVLSMVTSLLALMRRCLSYLPSYHSIPSIDLISLSSSIRDLHHLTRSPAYQTLNLLNAVITAPHCRRQQRDFIPDTEPHHTQIMHV